MIRFWTQELHLTPLCTEKSCIIMLLMTLVRCIWLMGKCWMSWDKKNFHYNPKHKCVDSAESQISSQVEEESILYGTTWWWSHLIFFGWYVEHYKMSDGLDMWLENWYSMTSWSRDMITITKAINNENYDTACLSYEIEWDEDTSVKWKATKIEIILFEYVLELHSKEAKRGQFLKGWQNT